MTKKQISEASDWLKTHFFAQYVGLRCRVFNELSDKQPMFCVCGKLATGLHENHCAKFNRAVDIETINRMRERLPEKYKWRV